MTLEELHAKPTKTIDLTVEQITAIRAMLKLELVGRITDSNLEVLFDGDEIKNASNKITSSFMRSMELYNSLDHPFVVALGSPLVDGEIMSKYQLNKVFRVTMLAEDFDVVADIIVNGMYVDYVQFALEEEDTLTGMVPAVTMSRNSERLKELFVGKRKEDPVMFNIPAPKGGLAN